jgi:hypothetical protein
MLNCGPLQEVAVAPASRSQAGTCAQQRCIFTGTLSHIVHYTKQSKANKPPPAPEHWRGLHTKRIIISIKFLASSLGLYSLIG